MSEAAIHNVIIVLPRIWDNPNCTFLYHNPFGPDSIRTGMTTVTNPKQAAEGFPQKARNLNGFQIELNYLSMPPQSMMRSNRLVGTDVWLGDLFVRTVNATSRSKLAAAQDLGWGKWKTLIMNKTPITINLEFVVSNGLESFYVMFSPRRRNSLHHFISIRWRKNYFFLLWAIHVSAIVLYVRVIRRDGGRKSGTDVCQFIGLLFLQTTALRMKTRLERLFFAFLLGFNFFVTTALLSVLTSDLIHYYPDRGIQSLEQLLQKRVPIYSNQLEFTAVNLVLQNSKLVDNVHLSNESTLQALLSPTNDQHHRARIINANKYREFLNSPMNRNAYGQSKFYLLDQVLMSYVYGFPFPANSPFIEPFHEFFQRTQEAGLKRYWTTRTMTHTNVDSWSYFKAEPFQRDQILQNMRDLDMVFRFIMAHYLLAGVVLLLEICHHKYPGWKTKSKRRWRQLYMAFPSRRN